VNNLIPPPKVLKVFLTVLEVEGDSFIGRSIKGLSEEFKGCIGNQGFKDSRSTKFKGYLEFEGVLA